MDQEAEIREMQELQAKLLRAEWPGTITRDWPFVMRWQEADDLVARHPFSTLPLSGIPSDITPHVNLDSTDPTVPTYTAEDVFRSNEIDGIGMRTHRVGPVTRMAISFVPTSDVAMLLKSRHRAYMTCDVVCVAVVHARYAANNPISHTATQYNGAYFIFNGKTGQNLDSSVANMPGEPLVVTNSSELALGGHHPFRGEVNLFIDRAVGKLRRRDKKPPYPELLPDELGMWYYYTTDYGHSVLCMIPQATGLPDPSIHSFDESMYLAFVPVKQVLRTGYRMSRQGFVWCDVPYSQELGVISEPDDTEY
jgi:hypothetical protein